MEAILSRSTRKLLRFEITKILIAVYKTIFELFIIIVGTLSFPIMSRAVSDCMDRCWSLGEPKPLLLLLLQVYVERERERERERSRREARPRRWAGSYVFDTAARSATHHLFCAAGAKTRWEAHSQEMRITIYRHTTTNTATTTTVLRPLYGTVCVSRAPSAWHGSYKFQLPLVCTCSNVRLWKLDNEKQWRNTFWRLWGERTEKDSAGFVDWTELNWFYWAHLHLEGLNCWINYTIIQWYRQQRKQMSGFLTKPG